MVPTPTLVFPQGADRQTVPMSVAAGSIHDDPKWLIEVRRAFPNLPIIQVPEPLVDINWSPVSISRPGVDRSEELINGGYANSRMNRRGCVGDYMLTSPLGSALGGGFVSAASPGRSLRESASGGRASWRGRARQSRY